jgi:hypothetical protein
LTDLFTTAVSVDVSELVPFPGSFALNGWVRTSSDSTVPSRM